MFSRHYISYAFEKWSNNNIKEKQKMIKQAASK